MAAVPHSSPQEQTAQQKQPDCWRRQVKDACYLTQVFRFLLPGFGPRQSKADASEIFFQRAPLAGL